MCAKEKPKLLKSKIDSTLTKAAAMCVNLNIDGAPITVHARHIDSFTLV